MLQNTTWRLGLPLPLIIKFNSLEARVKILFYFKNPNGKPFSKLLWDLNVNKKSNIPRTNDETKIPNQMISSTLREKH